VDEELLPFLDSSGMETSAAEELGRTVKQDAAVEAIEEATQAVKEDEAYEARQEAAQAAAEGSHDATTTQKRGDGTAVAGQENPSLTLELPTRNAGGETAQDADASPAVPSPTETPRMALSMGVPELDGGSEDSADVAALKRKIRDLQADLAHAVSTSTKPAEASTEPAAETAAGQPRDESAREAPVSTTAAMTREEMKRRLRQQLLDEMAATTTTPRETREQMKARMKAEMLDERAFARSS